MASRTQPRAARAARRRAALRTRLRAAGLEKLSSLANRFVGGSHGFAAAALIVILWGASGPLFGYSDAWQAFINTFTTLVTFLMVFLIQRSQNKDSLAIQLKLNELVSALEGASNRLIDIEDITEAELKALRRHYRMLAKMAKESGDLLKSRSVEEARETTRGARSAQP